MRSKLPYSEYMVKELIFLYIWILYSDRINTLVRTETYEEKDLEFFSSSRLRCNYVRSSTDLHLNVLHLTVSLILLREMLTS
jgi:hypothetical protein